MTKKLPVKLSKEPLFEAVCELRFSSDAPPLHNIVPGLLLTAFPGQVRDISQLSNSVVPDFIRAADPNMAYAPLISLNWMGLKVLVGSRSLTICNIAPYLGWAAFKQLIIKLLETVLVQTVTPTVERYSLKYQNLFKFGGQPDTKDVLDLKLAIGSLSLKPGSTFVRSEVIDTNYMTIIQLAQSATVQTSGKAPSEGLLIDIDTISTGPVMSCAQFKKDMSNNFDRARLVNKTIFFECLSDEVIRALGPTYADK